MHIMQKYFISLTKTEIKKCFHISSLGVILFGLAVNSWLWFPTKVRAQTDIYCRLSPEAIAQKENLRQGVLEDKGAIKCFSQFLTNRTGFQIDIKVSIRVSYLLFSQST